MICCTLRAFTFLNELWFTNPERGVHSLHSVHCKQMAAGLVNVRWSFANVDIIMYQNILQKVISILVRNMCRKLKVNKIVLLL